MSRTKRHRGKPPGYDYWSRRPPYGACMGYGKFVKKHTHRLERIQGKKAAVEGFSEANHLYTNGQIDPGEYRDLCKALEMCNTSLVEPPDVEKD